MFSKSKDRLSHHESDNQAASYTRRAYLPNKTIMNSCLAFFKWEAMKAHGDEVWRGGSYSHSLKRVGCTKLFALRLPTPCVVEYGCVRLGSRF